MSSHQHSSQITTTVYTLACGLVLVAGCIWYKKKQGKRNVLSNDYQKFKLIDKVTMTTGACPVKKFRFALPSKNSVLGLPVGQHIGIKATNPETGKLVSRSYTPTTSDADKGYFEIVVKIYPKGVMGQYLDHLQVGKDSVEVRGPKGQFLYKAGDYKHLGMLAGGSGITPMFQILTEVARHLDVDNTKCSLLYGNITVDDIILRKETQALVEQAPSQLSVYNVLNNPPPDWAEGSGFITEEHIKKNFPAPTEEGVKILICGPPPMINAMIAVLLKMGYSKETQIFCF
eukprot:NODE_5045_length_989_cov_22.124711_g4836_i0.p1 GENE.NODE_5045_length_989_cov_22.124711_g4836_i0~~NODE_5045_length_989_cov_22.124711_g4836_i0.p1  ORF type:complete len:287 (+),score=48.95 NODE_5045_length_989_cov_22.124711_g4836_i0:49-909(+)